MTSDRNHPSVALCRAVEQKPKIRPHRRGIENGVAHASADEIDVTRSVPISVLVVVANRLLSKALVHILQKRSGFSVTEQLADLSTVAEILRRSTSDVILLDSVTATPLISQKEFRMRELNPGAQVLIIGMEADESSFLRAVCADVKGYLLNEASATEVIAAIRSVARGEAVCPPCLRKVLFDTLAGTTSVPDVLRTRQRLTRRQQELLPMIARGLTNKEIAVRMNLSEQTVKNHVHRILRRTGANHRLQVTELAGFEDLTV